MTFHTEYEKVHDLHNGTFWREQTSKLVWNGLGREYLLIFFLVRGWGQGEGSQSLFGLNFLPAPPPNQGKVCWGLLIDLPRCGAREKGEKWGLKVSEVKYLKKWSQTLYYIFAPGRIISDSDEGRDRRQVTVSVVR